MINNKTAFDRFLTPSAAYKQLAGIKRVKNSTHEITLQINKAILLLKDKKVAEAKKELEDIYKLDTGAIDSIRDERFLVVKACILAM